MPKNLSPVLKLLLYELTCLNTSSNAFIFLIQINGLLIRILKIRNMLAVVKNTPNCHFEIASAFFENLAMTILPLLTYY